MTEFVECTLLQHPPSVVTKVVDAPSKAFFSTVDSNKTSPSIEVGQGVFPWHLRSFRKFPFSVVEFPVPAFESSIHRIAVCQVQVDPRASLRPLPSCSELSEWRPRRLTPVRGRSRSIQKSDTSPRTAVALGSAKIACYGPVYRGPQNQISLDSRSSLPSCRAAREEWRDAMPKSSAPSCHEEKAFLRSDSPSRVT